MFGLNTTPEATVGPIITLGASWPVKNFKFTPKFYTLKGPLGMRHFNVVNFKNLTYMKPYSLLILTENTKKSKNNFKAPKKSEIVIFPGRILPCYKASQQYAALHTTYSHFLAEEVKAIAANWCLIGVL